MRLRLIKSTSYIVLFFVMSLSILSSVHAQTGRPSTGGGTTGTPSNQPAPGSSACPGQTLCNPLQADSLEELLAIFLDVVTDLGAIILVLAIIWCGFLYVKARGNPGKISEAHKALMWTVIGGLILLGAKAIGEVIKATANSL